MSVAAAFNCSSLYSSARIHIRRVDPNTAQRRLCDIRQANRTRGSYARSYRRILPNTLRPISCDMHAVKVVEMRQYAEDEQMLP